MRVRADLIVITDDVYAPFVEGFRSAASAAPRQTIVLHSFSKFWGTTGLRLGVVGLHRDNALDARLAAATGDALAPHYYATIDIPALARERYGDAFAHWLRSGVEPIDFVVHLAEERGIVLLDGGGFDAPRMSVRVSLANLPDDAYKPIGRAIAELLGE